MSLAHSSSFTAMSQHSLSGHSSEPLTPPEVPPAATTSSHSPRSIRRSTKSTQQPPFDSYYGPQGPMPGYSPSMLMPTPSSYPQSYFAGSPVSPHMSSPLRPHESPYLNQYAAAPTHFGVYPQPYPIYPQYGGGVPMSHTLSQQSAGPSQSGLHTDTDDDHLDFDFEYDATIPHTPSIPAAIKLESPSKSPAKAQPPRPPNAWILYRSDRLKDISAGREVKGLDAVMRDSGISGSSASSGEESGPGRVTKGTTPATSVSAGTDEEKPVVKRKGKKGAKEPTEGLLRMGTGKTGRGLPQAHISKMISELWRRESTDVRREYEQRSEARKNEHANMYPNYKFTPVKKADKDRAKEERAREKQVAKQEKATRTATNRGKKGTRSRPSTATSPYSSMGGRFMDRSSSMSGVYQSSQALRDASATDQPPKVKDEDRYAMHPFPMPMGAVPALPDINNTGGLQSNKRNTPYQGYTPDQSRQQSPSKAPRNDYEMMPPPAPAQHYEYPQDRVSYGEMPPSQSYPYQPMSVNLAPQEGQYYPEHADYGQACPQPVIFDQQELPVKFRFDDLLQDYPEGNPEDLIATWCEVEEDVAGDTTGGEDSWQQDPHTVAASWGELSGDAQQQYFDELDLSVPMALDFAPYLANDHYTGAQPTVDYNSGYIAYPYPSADAGPSRTSDPGPFLSMAQPPSPEPNASTPRQSAFARSQSNTYASIPEHDTPILDAPHMVSRYVSSSAFPDTPLSVDPSGLGGNDRHVSYANAFLNESCGDDDNESHWHGSVGTPACEESKASEPTTPAASPAKQTPYAADLDLPLSPLSPSNSHGNAAALDSPSPQKGAGPPRGQRRARTVAGSYR